MAEKENTIVVTILDTVTNEVHVSPILKDEDDFEEYMISKMGEGNVNDFIDTDDESSYSKSEWGRYGGGVAITHDKRYIFSVLVVISEEALKKIQEFDALCDALCETSLEEKQLQEAKSIVNAIID